MGQIAIDASGKHERRIHQPVDVWNYNIRGKTQTGDQVYSEYGGRWLDVMYSGFSMPEGLRYRRRKQQQAEDR